MTVPVVAVALLFWACVFMVYFTQGKTTPGEFFLGRYEPPPPDSGTWKQVGSVQDGLQREERYWLPAESAGHLLQQTRYRDAVTRAIVRVEPDKKVRRRRVGRGRG